MEPTVIRELEPSPDSKSVPNLPEENLEKSNDEQDSKLRILTNNLHRLNDSIVQAVSAGLTVEIKRASRFHAGTGNWGDQIYLVVTKNA